jgi:hypothetical protein
MQHTLVATGMVSLALGAVSGFALAIVVESPDLLKRIGIAHPARVRQVHLDWIIMGLVLIATGPDMPDWVGVLVMAGAIVNPLLFIPLAIKATVTGNGVYRTITLASFTTLSTGLASAAVCALG